MSETYHGIPNTTSTRSRSAPGGIRQPGHGERVSSRPGARGSAAGPGPVSPSRAPHQRSQVRPVRPGRPDRRRKHGHGLQRTARDARPRRRDQSPAPGAQQRARSRPLRARSRAHAPARPRQYRFDPGQRVRPSWRAVLRDGIRRGRRSADLGRARRTAAGGARDRHPEPGQRSSQLRPSPGHRAPRRQTGEHHGRGARCRGPRQARRLRPGPDPGCSRDARERRGRNLRHAAVPGPRSDHRTRRDPPERRPVCARCGRLLPAHRAARVQRLHLGRALRQAPVRSAGRALAAQRASDPRGARGDRSRVSRQVTERAARIGRSAAERAARVQRAHAERGGGQLGRWRRVEPRASTIPAPLAQLRAIRHPPAGPRRR